MKSNDTDLTRDLRNLWTLVTAQPGISSRAIADELEVTHSRALKLIAILLGSGTLTREPGKVGTLRATVPMGLIEDKGLISWTPEYRLKLIKALVMLSAERPQKMLMERIAFLCDMPDQFLEANKGNYADAIKLADAGMTMII